MMFPANSTQRPLPLTHLLRGKMTDPCCLELLFWGNILHRALSWFNLAGGNYAPDSHLLTLPPAVGWGGEIEKRGNSQVEIKTV